MNDSATGVSRLSRLYPFLIAVAALVAYAPSFWGVFVFDDPDSIANNPTIRHLGAIGSVLSPPHDQGQTVAGRPVLNLSFAINYAVSGTAIWSYHLVNLAIHVLAGLVLYEILRRTVAGRNGLAFAAALIWTVHPLQTEAVTYVAQRAESLMGLFYLLTLYSFIRYADETLTRSAPGTIERSGTRQRFVNLWAAGSLIFCLLGMATKEVMVSAPVIVFLYDRTFLSGSFREAWRRHAPVHLALAATWALLAALVWSTHGRGGTSGLGLGVSWESYVLTQGPAIWHYLRLAVWPHPLIFDYGAEWVQSPWSAIPALAAAVLLALASLVLCLQGRPLGFAGICFFAILAPSSLVPGVRQTVAEHRMYLALAPVIAGVVVWIGNRLAARGPSAIRLGRILLVLAAAALMGVTVQRNGLYASELELWRDTAERRPQNPYAHNDYGDLLEQAGRPEAADGQFREALRLKPNYPEAWNNLGNILRAQGRAGEAAPCYERAIFYRPRYAEAYNNLGVALTDVDNLYQAVSAFGSALKIDPAYAAAWYNLGITLAKIGRFPEAISAYRAALRLRPGAVEIRLNLGNALAGSGRVEEAIAEYRDILRLRPDYAEAHFNLGNALALADRLSEAAGEYVATLHLKPDYGPAKRNLERLRALTAPGP